MLLTPYFRIQLKFYSGGSGHILFRGVCNFAHPYNLLTTFDTELKFYMVIDIDELFPKIEKSRLKVLIMHL